MTRSHLWSFPVPFVCNRDQSTLVSRRELTAVFTGRAIARPERMRMKMGPLIRVALGLTILGAVAAADAPAQDAPGAGLPGIASFEYAASRSAVPLVAVLSFASLVIGLAALFTRRPRTAQLTPPEPESGLHRAQRALQRSHRKCASR
jgi:hypothetical protein